MNKVKRIARKYFLVKTRGAEGAVLSDKRNFRGRNEKLVPDENGKPVVKRYASRTVRYRHLSPSIRGKQNIKAAKQAKVKAMKEAQNL